MSDIQPNRPGLSEFEAALGSLQPVALRCDRDVLMFRAGRAAALRANHRAGGSWFWPAAAICMTCVSLVLALNQISRPTDRVAEKTAPEIRNAAPPSNANQPAPSNTNQPTPSELVELPRMRTTPYKPDFAAGDHVSETKPPRPATDRSISYLRLRDLVLRHGVSAWPAPTATGFSRTSAPRPRPLMPYQYRRQMKSFFPSEAEPLSGESS